MQHEVPKVLKMVPMLFHISGVAFSRLSGISRSFFIAADSILEIKGPQIAWCSWVSKAQKWYPKVSDTQMAYKLYLFHRTFAKFQIAMWQVFLFLSDRSIGCWAWMIFWSLSFSIQVQLPRKLVTFQQKILTEPNLFGAPWVFLECRPLLSWSRLRASSQLWNCRK